VNDGRCIASPVGNRLSALLCATSLVCSPCAHQSTHLNYNRDLAEAESYCIPAISWRRAKCICVRSCEGADCVPRLGGRFPFDAGP
jgi:hypothetical protein